MCYWLLVVRDHAAVPPTIQDIPHNKQFPGPNVNSAELRNGRISKSPLCLVLSPLQTRASFIADSLPDVSGPIPPEGLCKCIAPTDRLTGQCH